MLRPTASFSAYHEFMRNLEQRMEPRHFAAYEDSVFRHYVHFGPSGVDLPTFEHILSQWDEKRKKFVFTDRNGGEEIACSFNLEWVIEHTWFSNEGDLVDHNQDKKNRIWSSRRLQGTWVKTPLHKKKRGEEDDILIDAVGMPQDADEDIEQPNEAVEKMKWPQQVIYRKSIASMNQALRRDNENKFKDLIATDRVKINDLSVKVAKLSTQNRRLREEFSKA
ncbi:uncharacterized protein A4U43_C03F22740 [Asparagus officinalis]|uniref:Uncharacterized protein n=1 Tax=Asparagus officinalis TaxID=4686 RepID=A0A5P1FC88_ASPOF|nr:uncharacterized protein A4U43_C03F22740 [Asparagus officinalis]